MHDHLTVGGRRRIDAEVPVGRLEGAVGAAVHSEAPVAEHLAVVATLDREPERRELGLAGHDAIARACQVEIAATRAAIEVRDHRLTRFPQGRDAGPQLFELGHVRGVVEIEQHPARERVLERPFELEPDRGCRPRGVAAEQREPTQGFVPQRPRHAHFGDAPRGGSDERAAILAAVERERAGGEAAPPVSIVGRLRMQRGAGCVQAHTDLDRTVILDGAARHDSRDQLEFAADADPGCARIVSLAQQHVAGHGEARSPVVGTPRGKRERPRTEPERQGAGEPLAGDARPVRVSHAGAERQPRLRPREQAHGVVQRVVTAARNQ